MTMTKTRPEEIARDTPFEREAARFYALAHPYRLALLEIIASTGGEMCVDELTQAFGLLEQPSVSNHLGWLRGAGILNKRRKHLYVYYTLNHAGLRQIQRDIDALIASDTAGKNL